jgi:hypothetical protein
VTKPARNAFHELLRSRARRRWPRRYRRTHLDAHGNAIELELAAERALDKAHAQLRTVHDKRIFTRRREARKASPKARRQRSGVAKGNERQRLALIARPFRRSH